MKITRWLAVIGCLMLVSACTKPIDLTGWPCGEKGECGAEHICNGGICERKSPPGETIGPNIFHFFVGATCEADEDCQGVNKKDAAVCKLQDANTSWPDGYCTMQCLKDEDCNPDNNKANKATCWRSDSTKTGTCGECRKLCESDVDCKTSYACSILPGTASKRACLPAQ
jgi:hypothetical protein